MLRITTVLGIGIVCLALAVSVDAGGGKEKGGEPKGMLPPGFKDLKITVAQKKSIYAIQSEYRAKIADLEKKILELKTQANADVFKVLTPEQQTQYFRAKGIDPKDKAATPKDKASDKKSKASDDKK